MKNYLDLLMEMAFRINLENLRFYSYHGFYPEEQILGNEYSLTIKTVFSCQHIEDIQLENTVNYEQLYAIATNSMNKPRKLLETVAKEILQETRNSFQNLNEVEVSICKLNPPFGGDKAQARVSLLWLHNEKK